MKQKRQILIPLGDLKHRLEADRHELTRITLHLRELQTCPNMEYLAIFERKTLKDIEIELEDFNAERLGDIFDRVNKLIEEA